MVAFEQGVYLAWEPWNIPARYPSIVLDYNFKVLKFDGSDRVECDIEKDKRPFEEGVDGVCWKQVSNIRAAKPGKTYLQPRDGPCAG
jgi:hypothetical protein